MLMPLESLIWHQKRPWWSGLIQMAQKRQPPWTILNILSSYDAYEYKQLKLKCVNPPMSGDNLRPTGPVESTSDK